MPKQSALLLILNNDAGAKIQTDELPASKSIKYKKI
jgi:hypothetical protein